MPVAPTLMRQRQENYEFRANLGYRANYVSHSKQPNTKQGKTLNPNPKQWLGTAVHTCNPGTEEVTAGGLQRVQRQPGLQSE